MNKQQHPIAQPSTDEPHGAKGFCETVKETIVVFLKYKQAITYRRPFIIFRTGPNRILLDRTLCIAYAGNWNGWLKWHA